MISSHKQAMRTLTALMLFAAAILIASCSKKTEISPEKDYPDKPGLVIEDIRLEDLVKAAQAEGRVVVYMTSSRVREAGENFEKLYGIKVQGIKMKDGEQAERIIGEVDAGYVQVDVIAPEDGPMLLSTLLPAGYVINWVPKDMTALLSGKDIYPLVNRWQPRIFVYNNETWPKGPPVRNIWELTETKWKGKVILPDLSISPATRAFLAQLVLDHEIIDKAYSDFYGKKLQTQEENAGWEFISRFFSNGLIALGTDDAISEAVGARGQSDPPVGLITFTKLRENEVKNLSLATCQGLEPFMGYALATYTALVANAPHPNAAKLFIRFLLTPEGIAPWLEEMGCFSPNPAGFVHPDNEGSWTDWLPRLVFIENDRVGQISQKINDLWLKSGY